MLKQCRDKESCIEPTIAFLVGILGFGREEREYIFGKRLLSCPSATQSFAQNIAFDLGYSTWISLSLALALAPSWHPIWQCSFAVTVAKAS